jgi:DNA polymerase
MTKLWIDSETFSEIPITHGTHVYAASAEVMIITWAIDDGDVHAVDFTNGELMPAELVETLHDPETEVWAQNSQFDRTVFNHGDFTLIIPVERWRDTMVQALAHALPAHLGQLCEALGVPADKSKDKDGRRLIQLFCKPQTRGKVRRATRNTHPDDWARFISYAKDDIVAMRECHKRMPTWNYKGAEVDLWHLDQRINDRGVGIDMELVKGALAAVDVAQAELRAATTEHTEGQVESTTQRAALLDYIAEQYGILMADLTMATVERLVDDSETDPGLRQLLRMRLQASTTSTSKYKTLARGTSADGRLRGTLQFNGAARTGRWAGRLFQPQNLPRPTLKQEQIELGIVAIKDGAADLVFDNVMQLTSSALRSVIVPRPGKKLVVADLSNIEGRDQAWLAGESWKLQAFTDFDNKVGPDLYKLAYGKTFNIKPEAVTKDQRQVGKVQELALGYEGGVGAFVTFADAYKIDLEKLGAEALPLAPGWAVDEASSFYEWMLKKGGDTYGLSRDAFVACDAIKRGWRFAHKAISSYWGELRDAVLAAIIAPGTTIPCRKVKVRCDGKWLRVGLPSGRAICYPSPQIAEDGKAITYMGLNQFSRKWVRLSTYGGKIFENICQAVARDVMTTNMPHIEAAGYAIVLTVHDEVICEAPDDPAFNADHLSGLLCAQPPWALDMPLAAAGFEAARYRKD